MTISTTVRRNDYVGDNSTDTYAYSWHINASSELLVTQRDTDGVEETLTLTTDYTVTGVDDTDGGTIVLVGGNLADGYTLTIRGNDPLTQTTDIRNQSSYLPEVIEDTFDHLVKIDQQQQDEIDRSVKLPESISSDDFDPTLPTDLLDADPNAVPMTNDTGTGWEVAEDWPTASSISTAGASATAAAASAAAAAASATAASSYAGQNGPYGINNLGLSAAVAANALTVTLTQADGSTAPASGSGAVSVWFRSTTATTGSMTQVSATSAVTCPVTSGATLGHNDALADYVYIYAINNAGTLELAVSSSCHWDEGQLVSTTTMSNGADSATGIYSTTGRSNVACRLIGRLLSTQTTAGTWASAITRVEVGNLFAKQDITFTRAASFIAKHGAIYNVSTAGARTVTLPAPVAGFIVTIKDSTGQSETNNITVTPTSGTINGISGNKLLGANYGTWKFESDGTNWFTTITSDCSYTVFDGSTSAGSDTIPTSFASPTLSAATVTKGLPVTRSTNTLTFPFAGKYLITFDMGRLTFSAVNTNLLVRIRNTTSSATTSLAVQSHGTGDSQGASLHIPTTITNAAHAFELQWAHGGGGTLTVETNTVDSETGPRWRIIIQYLGV